jgi:predicted nuclease with TOPRIM domain
LHAKVTKESSDFRIENANLREELKALEKELEAKQNTINELIGKLEEQEEASNKFDPNSEEMKTYKSTVVSEAIEEAKLIFQRRCALATDVNDSNDSSNTIADIKKMVDLVIQQIEPNYPRSNLQALQYKTMQMGNNPIKIKDGTSYSSDIQDLLTLYYIRGVFAVEQFQITCDLFLIKSQMKRFP